MVALTWDQTGGGPVSVSFERGGHASHQLSVVQDVDAEPGLGTAESGGVKPSSDLYWTGGSRCIRLSFRLPGEVVLSNPRAVFINTSGTAAGPGTGPPERATTEGGMLGGLFGASAAEAMTTRPPIVRRYQWGAAKPRPNCLEYAPEIKMAYVHHTSGSNSYSRSQSDDIVRGIQYYHEHVRGYCDIAYSFLVDKFGTVFEGRAGSMTTNVIPGSQSGFNTYTFSVSAIGNFQSAFPSSAMVSAIERVLAWRLDVAHVPAIGSARMESAGGTTDRYRKGQLITLPDIAGHRQTSFTDCPGNNLYALLPTIRGVVSRIGLPKILYPREGKRAFVPVIQEVKFTATGTSALQWDVDIADASGNVVRTFTASGDQLSVYWDGTDQQGLPLPPGKYTVTIGGNRSDGKLARPAVLTVALRVQGTPTPSPSPSPSVSPSPTPTGSPSPTPSPTASV